MNWLEGFIYGLLSGFTEILPVSSQAHQNILMHLFGMKQSDPVANLIVHIAVLLALLIGCRGMLFRLRREQKNMQRGRRRHSADIRSSYDLRLLRTAVVPTMLFMLLLIVTRNWKDNSLLIALFSVLNGLIIFLAERFPHGNKDSRHVSILDAIIFGTVGALSVLPGVSRIGTSQAYATVRGVDRQQSHSWAMILSIPALFMLCIFDIVGIAGGIGGAQSFSLIAGYILAGIGAFVGAYLCIFSIRTVINRINMAGFAYYSWGVALFIFVLYLIS